MIDERTNMIIARLRQLWVTFQAANPDPPYPASEVPLAVKTIVRAQPHAKSLWLNFNPSSTN